MKPPPKSTERVRAFRQREADGDLLVSVRLTEDETDTLHRRGYLPLDAVEDRGAAAHAIKLLLRAEKQRLESQ